MQPPPPKFALNELISHMMQVLSLYLYPGLHGVHAFESVVNSLDPSGHDLHEELFTGTYSCVGHAMHSVPDFDAVALLPQGTQPFLFTTMALKMPI